jgi:DNA-binding IclR family transcriptional regulator
MRALGIPRSTLSDLLAELRELGYVQVMDRRYAAGPRLVSLIHRRLARGTRVLSGVQKVLDQIALSTGETSVYAIDAGAAVVALAQSPGTDPIRYVATLWEPFPLDETAPGMLFQAHGPNPPRHLAEVREQGFAVWAPDQSRPAAIAMPVHDSDGAMVGALVVIGPKDRLSTRERLIRDALRLGVARLEAGDPGGAGADNSGIDRTGSFAGVGD